MSQSWGEADRTEGAVVDAQAPPDSGAIVPDPRRWHALAVIALAQLMVVLDASIVNLALPSAKRALHISDANQQWVVTAYTLAFGGLLVLGGRVADYAAVTVTGGLIALVYGFTKAAPVAAGDPSRWSDPATLGWFGLALALLVSFFVIETHTAHPLLPMRVLLDRSRGASYLVSLINGIGLFGMFLFLSLYLQAILGFSPLKAGFAFLPFSVGIILTARAPATCCPRSGHAG